MSEYRTKVMKPSNLKGLCAAKEAIEEAIVEAEQKATTGEISVTVHMKDGGTVAVKQSSDKSVKLPG